MELSSLKLKKLLFFRRELAKAWKTNKKGLPWRNFLSLINNAFKIFTAVKHRKIPSEAKLQYRYNITASWKTTCSKLLYIPLSRTLDENKKNSGREKGSCWTSIITMLFIKLMLMLCIKKEINESEHFVLCKQ